MTRNKYQDQNDNQRETRDTQGGKNNQRGDGPRERDDQEGSPEDFVPDGMHQMKEQITHTLSWLDEQIRTVAKKRPGTTILATVAIGFVLGRIFSRR